MRPARSSKPGATERIWELTAWPAVAGQCAGPTRPAFKDRAGRDRRRSIGAGAVDRARKTLVRNRVTHLDQLASQMREERVRRCDPAHAGRGPVNCDYSMRDLEYVRDLGLVATQGRVRMANPIYAEVIPRELTAAQESGLESQVSPSWYVNEDGSLDIKKLIRAFQVYFRGALRIVGRALRPP